MRFYEDINLPNLDAFRNERVEMPKRSKPRALDTGVIAAINAAAPKLASTDPAVYVAFLMFSRLGLRNIEIRNARWSWIENGRIGIIERPEENFYPKGSEGWVPIAPDVLKELMRFRNLIDQRLHCSRRHGNRSQRGCRPQALRLGRPMDQRSIQNEL